MAGHVGIWAEIMGKRQGLQLRSENLHCNSPKKLLYISPDSHQQCKKVIMFWKIGKKWLKGFHHWLIIIVLVVVTIITRLRRCGAVPQQPW